MAGEEYILPIGVDATGLVEGLRQAKAEIAELSNLAKQSAQGTKDAFSAASTAITKVAGEAVNVTKQVSEQGKTYKENATQLQNLSALFTKLTQQAPKAFDTSLPKEFGKQIQNFDSYMIEFADSATFSDEKIQKLTDDLAKSTSNLEEFKTVLAFIKENIGDLKLSDLGTEDLLKSITSIETLMNEATGSAENFSNSLKNIGSADEALAGISEELAKTKFDFDSLVEAVTKAEQVLDSLPEGSDAYNKLQEGISEANAALDKFIEEQTKAGQETMNAVDAQMKASKAADDHAASIERLAERLKSLTGSEDSTTTEQMQQLSGLLSEIAQKAPKAFDQNLPAEFGKQISTFSNYMAQFADSATFSDEKINKLTEDISKTTSELDVFKTVLAFIKENIGDLKIGDAGTAELLKTIEGLDKGIEQISAIGNASETATPKTLGLYTQLRAIKQEMAEMATTDPRFNELAKEAARLQAEISNTHKQVKLLASTTRNLDVGIQAVQGMVGVFAAAQGAAGLLGEKNEELQKTLLKVNSAMAILQGMQQVSAILDKNSALNIALQNMLRGKQVAATTAQAVALGGEAVATGAATTAQLSLNAAMAANPAAVLLLAVGALVGAYMIFGNSSEKAEEQQKRLNETLNETNQIMVELARSYVQIYTDKTKEAEKAVSLAQAQGKSEAEIFSLKQKALQARQNEAKATLANLGLTEKDVKYNEELLTVRQEQLHAILATVDANKDMTDADKKRVENIKAEIAAIKAITGPGREALEKIKAAQDAMDVNAAANLKKQFEEGLKSATALAEAKVLLAKKGSEEELNAQITAIRAGQREALSNVNLTAGERIKVNAEADKKIQELRRQFRIAELQDEISEQQDRINLTQEGSKEEFEAKKAILDKQAAIEVENAKDNAVKLKEIYSRYTKAKAELEKQYNAAIIESAVNAEISRVNAALSVAEKSSESELNLKKYLIDQQAALGIESARKSIKDEQERLAKIEEINKKAIADKIALDQQYYKAKLDAELKLQLSIQAIQNANLKGVVGDPNASEREKFRAQQQIRQNELEALFKQRADITQLYLKGMIPDRKEYETQINALIAQSIDKRNEILNADLEYQKKHAFSFKNLFKEIQEDLFNTLFKGVGDSDKSVLKGAFNDLIGGLGTALGGMYDALTIQAERAAQAQVDAIQKAIDKTDEQIKEQEKIVDRQMSLSDKGLANDMGNEAKKLADLKAKKAEEVKAREEAQKKLENIRKQEAIVQAASTVATNIETGINMINAASKIFKAHSGIPFAGIAIAVGLVALMASSFLAIKNAFKTQETPKFRHGGGKDLAGQKLVGPSHEQGGMTLYNNRTKEAVAEYEGNEYLYAVKRESTAKYLPLLEAINSDSLPVRNTKEFRSLLGPDHAYMPAEKLQQIIIVQREVEDRRIYSLDFKRADLMHIADRIDKFHNTIVDQHNSKVERVDMGDYWLETEGNITRKIMKKRG